MGNYFWFSSIKIDYSDYLKNLFSRINEVYVVVFYSDILLKKTNFILAVCFATIELVIM